MQMLPSSASGLAIICRSRVNCWTWACMYCARSLWPPCLLKRPRWRSLPGARIVSLPSDIGAGARRTCGSSAISWRWISWARLKRRCGIRQCPGMADVVGGLFRPQRHRWRRMFEAGIHVMDLAVWLFGGIDHIEYQDRLMRRRGKQRRRPGNGQHSGSPRIVPHRSELDTRAEQRHSRVRQQGRGGGRFTLRDELVVRQSLDGRLVELRVPQGDIAMRFGLPIRMQRSCKISHTPYGRVSRRSRLSNPRSCRLRSLKGPMPCADRWHSLGWMRSRKVMRYSRILITGATGFIGSRLCENFTLHYRPPYRALVQNYGRAARIAWLGCEMVAGTWLIRRALTRRFRAVTRSCIWLSAMSERPRRTCWQPANERT